MLILITVCLFVCFYLLNYLQYFEGRMLSSWSILTKWHWNLHLQPIFTSIKVKNQIRRSSNKTVFMFVFDANFVSLFMLLPTTDLGPLFQCFDFTMTWIFPTFFRSFGCGLHWEAQHMFVTFIFFLCKRFSHQQVHFAHKFFQG